MKLASVVTGKGQALRSNIGTMDVAGGELENSTNEKSDVLSEILSRHPNGIAINVLRLSQPSACRLIV